MNETLLEAKIKTSFFTDQLSFQLFCFSILLAAIGFFSRKLYLEPLKNKLINLEETKLPKFELEIENKLSSEISTINNNLTKLTETTANQYGISLYEKVQYHKDKHEFIKVFEAQINLINYNLFVLQYSADENFYRDLLNNAYKNLTKGFYDYYLIQKNYEKLREKLINISKSIDYKSSKSAHKLLEELESINKKFHELTEESPISKSPKADDE